MKKPPQHCEHCVALSSQKQKALKTSRQAAGTLARVSTMIESDSYCPLVIQQLDSVLGLLTTVRRELLVGHLNTCLEEQLHQDKQKAIDELVKIFNLSK